MKKIIYSAFIFTLFISNMAFANQIINHWRSDDDKDTIQISPGNNKVYLLITNDKITKNGDPGCVVNIEGCQRNLVGLSPGDAALCEPNIAVGSVQITSKCTYMEDQRTVATGTYQFSTKK